MPLDSNYIRNMSRDMQLLYGLSFEYTCAENMCAMAAGLYIVYSEKINLQNNQFIIDIKDVITNELLSSLGKLFSSASFDDTISLYALNLNNNQQLEKELRNIRDDYDCFKKIRDKRVSHLDMIVLKEMEEVVVDINKIQILLERIEKFIKSSITDWDEYFTFNDINKKINYYEKQFRLLFKNM